MSEMLTVTSTKEILSHPKGNKAILLSTKPQSAVFYEIVYFYKVGVLAKDCHVSKFPELINGHPRCVTCHSPYVYVLLHNYLCLSVRYVFHARMQHINKIFEQY